MTTPVIECRYYDLCRILCNTNTKTHKMRLLPLNMASNIVPGRLRSVATEVTWRTPPKSSTTRLRWAAYTFCIAATSCASSARKRATSCTLASRSRSATCRTRCTSCPRHHALDGRLRCRPQLLLQAKQQAFHVTQAKPGYAVLCVTCFSSKTMFAVTSMRTGRELISLHEYMMWVDDMYCCANPAWKGSLVLS
jgi:hypothetical protein